MLESFEASTRMPDRNAINYLIPLAPSLFLFLLSHRVNLLSIMVGRHVFASCVAALSAVVSAQIELSAPNFTQIPTIFDRVNTPFTFTDCAAPKEMQACWQAQNFTNEYKDDACSGLQNRIECALTNCWNKVTDA